MIPPNVQELLDRHAFVCGSDECGYGAWAGPLTACAVIVPTGWTLPGVTDSKKLSKKKRESLYDTLLKLPHGIACVTADEIDEMGMSAAWELAHYTAISQALDAASSERHETLVVIDGVRAIEGATPVPKADLLIPAVSAASIIGKVYRDRLMEEISTQYPQYGFDKSVGYGTKKHQEALQAFGVTPLHRKSYRPIRDLLGDSEPVEKPFPQDLMSFLEELE